LRQGALVGNFGCPKEKARYERVGSFKSLIIEWVQRTGVKEYTGSWKNYQNDKVWKIEKTKSNHFFRNT